MGHELFRVLSISGSLSCWYANMWQSSELSTKMEIIFYTFFAPYCLFKRIIRVIMRKRNEREKIATEAFDRLSRACLWLLLFSDDLERNNYCCILIFFCFMLRQPSENRGRARLKSLTIKSSSKCWWAQTKFNYRHTMEFEEKRKKLSQSRVIAHYRRR